MLIFTRVSVIVGDAIVLLVSWRHLHGTLKSSHVGVNRRSLGVLLLRDGEFGQFAVMFHTVDVWSYDRNTVLPVRTFTPHDAASRNLPPHRILLLLNIAQIIAVLDFGQVGLPIVMPPLIALTSLSELRPHP